MLFTAVVKNISMMMYYIIMIYIMNHDEVWSVAKSRASCATSIGHSQPHV